MKDVSTRAPRDLERELFWHERNPAIAEVPLASLAEPPGPESLTFVRRHFDLPAIDEGAFRLVIDGAVGEARSLSIDDLKQRPFVRRTLALECAGNARKSLQPPVPRVGWGLGGASIVEIAGTPLASLLDRAGPRREAREVLFVGADSGKIDGRLIAYERTLTLEDAMAAGVLLVWEMNGMPLSPEQGAPLRVIVPGWYAMASVKWLVRISVLAEAYHAYYQHDDYVYEWPDGRREPVTSMKPRAVIVSPRDGDRAHPGVVTIAGIAWSGVSPLERVLVSVDGGDSWEAAAIEPVASRGEGASGVADGGRGDDGHGPARWHFSWTPPAPGRFEILARAVDRSGCAQPLAPEWNALGYGNNSVQRVGLSVVTRRA
jgi:DMSO/TMAO reductase YedYZ molybdopterin-dependent catalytic subunit